MSQILIVQGPKKVIRLKPFALPPKPSASALFTKRNLVMVLLVSAVGSLGFFYSESDAKLRRHLAQTKDELYNEKHLEYLGKFKIHNVDTVNNKTSNKSRFLFYNREEGEIHF